MRLADVLCGGRILGFACLVVCGCGESSTPKSASTQPSVQSDKQASKGTAASTDQAASSDRSQSDAGRGKAPNADKSEPAAADMSERTFKFTYAATINDLPPGVKARIWVPLAATNREQDVEIVKIDVPGEYREEKDATYGNAMLYFEGTADDAGDIPLSVAFKVTRRGLPRTGVEADPRPMGEFLAGSVMVPVTGEILKRFFSDMPPEGKTMEVARALYDRVDLHMKYDKSVEGWGRGDVLWACDSGRGNCSDFHSIFISLCRDLKIPAKFEIGFPIPTDKSSGEIGGYHCWAKFLDDNRWVGVDISEADKNPNLRDFLFGNLPPDRVMFSTERDLQLVPSQDGGPVNFLVYPYVGVDGKPYSKQVRKFTFENL